MAAGTYPELVIADKSLTFEGANAGRSAGTTPVARTAESVVKGFRNPGEPHPTAAGQSTVVVDGFTIDPQGDAGLIAAPTHHLVSLFGGTGVVKVVNNVFDGGPFVADCDYQCTTMTDAAVMVQSGGFVVSDNSFTDFRAPIDVTQFDPAHPITAASISRNHFTHVTNRAVWVREDPTGGPFPGTVSITDNVFDATGWTSADWAPAGIVMTSGGNAVTGNSFTAFGSGVFLQVCDGTNGAGSANHFVGNAFSSNRSGIQHYVVDHTTCPSIAPEITANRFEGTFTGAGLVDVPEIGVRWNGDVGANGAAAPGVLVAECNWWGVADGPGLNGSAGLPGQTTVTENVDVSPWNATPSGACGVG